MNSDPQLRKTALVVGASRGLGYALAEEFLKRDWNVVGTVRGPTRTRPHELAQRSPGRIEIETLDITMPDQIDALRSRVGDRKLDIDARSRELGQFWDTQLATSRDIKLSNDIT